MTKLAGQATVKKNGSVLRILPGAKLNMGGSGRKFHEGPDGVTGWTATEWKAPAVECTAQLAKGEKLSDMDFEDATVVFETDAGQVFILTGAGTTEPPDFEGGDGKVAMKIGAMTCKEA